MLAADTFSALGRWHGFPATPMPSPPAGPSSLKPSWSTIEPPIQASFQHQGQHVVPRAQLLHCVFSVSQSVSHACKSLRRRGHAGASSSKARCAAAGRSRTWGCSKNRGGVGCMLHMRARPRAGPSAVCLAQADEVERQRVASAERERGWVGKHGGRLSGEGLGQQSQAVNGPDWSAAGWGRCQTVPLPGEGSAPDSPTGPLPRKRARRAPAHFSMNSRRTTRAVSLRSVSMDVGPCATGPARRPSSSTSSPDGVGWGGVGWGRH